MKNIANKKINADPIAKARKNKHFEQFSQEAKERIRLGIEIYQTRKALNINQQDLAKKALTTQKVISNIENGDVNVGFALLNRIANVLNLNCENWSRIFNFKIPKEKSVKYFKKSLVSQSFSCKENQSEKYKN